MILRRVIEHFRKQEWSAIAIDFVIVVGGVFIGMQVSNWNEARSDRAYERNVLSRLHSEILTLEEGRDTPASVKGHQALKELRPVLLGVSAEQAISPQACKWLIRSHALNGPPDSLPALDELISSGRMRSLRNADIRDAASAYLQKREFGRDLLPIFDNDLRVLSREFPELMWVQAIRDSGDDDGPRTEAVCNLNAMRENSAFLTAYLNNLDRFDGIIKFHFEFVGEALDDLHDAVDDELGLRHDLKKSEETE